MQATGDRTADTDLTGSQAARLLRSGELGGLLIARASAGVERHRAVAHPGDQASGLREAVRESVASADRQPEAAA